MIIAVAGTGYVGLSNAVLPAQNNEVYAVDVIPEKVELINKFVFKRLEPKNTNKCTDPARPVGSVHYYEGDAG